MGESFFSEDGWDGSLDDTDLAAAEPVVEAAAEPAAEPEAEAVAAEPEAAAAEPEERPRDEKGRFIPKNLDESVAVDDPELQALLAKYKDDPLEALRAAAEAQRHVGSVHQEIGQLRQQMEEFTNRPAPEPAAPHTQITQDLIDQNPAAATQLAYEQGNQVALQIAFQAWKDDDPVDAAVWVTEQRAAARESQLRQELEQVRASVGPVAQSQEDAAFANAVREITGNDPDALERIKTGANSLPPETAETLYWALENGTPTQKIGAFRALAELTRPPGADTVDVRALAREQALAADEAIAEASVVSASTTNPVPVGKSMADQIGDEWDELEKPLVSGWNIS